MIDIKDYVKKMLKIDYDLICQELLPADIVLFTEKYINGKSNADLKMSEKDSKILDEKLVKIISSHIRNSIDNLSKTQLEYRCKRLNKSKEYTNFCIDAFIKKLKNKELAEKYVIELDTVRHYKFLRKKELTQII